MIRNLQKSALRIAALAATIALAGCPGGSQSGGSLAGRPPLAGSPPAEPTPDENAAPTISGTPPEFVVAGQAYLFTPVASDPDGDDLSFSIENQPEWSNFDESTGALSGVAPAGSEGRYAEIRINANDGTDSSTLGPFAIEVIQAALGSATLSWTPPTQNTDGSALTDLAGYRIYYGTSTGAYTTRLQVDNPGVTTYLVENLPHDTYYFVATALNLQGFESGFSNETMIVVD